MNAETNIEKRLIYITGDIDSDTCKSVNYALIQINQYDNNTDKLAGVAIERKPIQIYIDSYGGNVYFMWSIIDCINNIKTPVDTYCFGCAFSAALMIFIAGRNRYTSSHASFLHHSIFSVAGGNIKDITDEADHIKVLQEYSNDFLKERTKLPESIINDVIEMRKDQIIYAKNALKYGIATEIIN